MVDAKETKFYRRNGAAQFLKTEFSLPTSTGHLAKLAVIGGGPPFHRFSRFPIYSESDLVNWATAKLGRAVSSTSEASSVVAQAKPTLSEAGSTKK